MQVQVSPEVNALLDDAVALSARRQQCYVGVEHLFEALVEKIHDLPASFAEEYQSTLQAVTSELVRHPWPGTVAAAGPEIFFTPRLGGLTNEAARLAKRLSGGPPAAAHLLLAILADAYALPSRILDQQGQARGPLLEALRQELIKPDGGAGPGKPVPGPSREEWMAAAASESNTTLTRPAEEAAPGQGHARPGLLASLTRDLTQEARDGKLESVVGRRQELFDLLQILTRKNKNNAMLVGEAGVGKTKIVEGLADANAKGKLGGILSGYRVLELNIAALMAGTQYRGAFEEKVAGLLDELKRAQDVILFIDEIHLVMGTGSTDGDSMDLANLLKPALARGEFRCIGATTLQEYRKFIEKDPAIDRRFQQLRIEPLSEEATLRVLGRLRSSLEAHHEVSVGQRAMEAAVTLTQRYMPNRQLPDKAIDVLDQACARYRLKLIALQAAKPERRSQVKVGAHRVTPHDVRRVISRITSIPIEEMTAEERRQMGALDRVLKTRVIGQDEAVTQAVSAVKKSRAGLADPNRPDAVMLFLGPTGVGKTELAKALAHELFGSASHLLNFDMSEFVEAHSVSRLLGAPPGYVGSDEEGRLTGAVRNTPFSLVVFDEIEKAHPSIFDILLPILDEGRIRDARRGEVSFRNCIIVLTSNIGAQSLSRPASGDDRAELMAELREHFRPEFINRIDEIVPFYPLLPEDLRAILTLSVKRLARRLKEKQLGLHVYQGAYEYLAEQGYSNEFGARELRRTLDRLVTNPISDMVLQDQFVPGDTIEVLIEDGALAFRKGKAKKHGKEVAP